MARRGPEGAGPRPLVPHDVFRRLDRARTLIHDDCAAALTLDALAATAGLSRWHFARSFAAAFGEPPLACLRRVRLQRAKVLLARPGATVTDVCFEVGFASLGSFSSLFAREVGVPPSEWQRLAAPSVRVDGWRPPPWIPCFYGWYLRAPQPWRSGG